MKTTKMQRVYCQSLEMYRHLMGYESASAEFRENAIKKIDCLRKKTDLSIDSRFKD